MLEKIQQIPQVAAMQKQLDALPNRDRMALKMLAFALFVFLLIFAVLKPAYDFSEDKLADRERNKNLLIFIKENENALRAASRAGTSANTSKKLDSQQLVSTVTSKAKRFGLNLKRFEPSGDNKLKVWIEKSSFDKTIRWLTDLRKSLSIGVEQVSIERSDDPGVVNVRLTLSS